ncbi:B box-type domain-containing protein [Podarcis lilfordi]|nr:B box-type domain-containing protein [Podarcis lilfordi]
MPAYNIEEASTEPYVEDRPESQSGGSLLHGVFDEEESAKSFQEALNQWRSRNHCQKSKEERSCQVGPENTGSCQVQTSPPVAKKAMEIEFKEDGLKYMERLLIKKHRRTPVDKLPDSIITDELKLEKPQINEPDDTWVGGEDDDDEDDDDIAFARFEAKEMKKYWADVSKGEEPEALLANIEPSLEIRVLEDACKEEPEEPANFVVSEAGSDDLIDYSGPMSENQKTEPDVSSLSPAAQKEQCVNVLHNKQKETPRARAPFAESGKADGAWGCSGAEETVPCTPFKGAAAKEKHSKTRKISTRKKSEQASRPPKSAPREPCAVMSAESHEASPLTAKSSVLLQEIAQKEKPSCAPYRGLEEFFTSCEQVMMESFPLPRAGRQSPSRGISFSGSQQWMRQFSLSECADESVVQDVLERELGRPSSRLGRQSPGPRAYRSKLSIENASARPLSANIPFCRTITPTLRPSSVLQTGSESSATWPLSRAASEISEIEGIDVTEHDDPFLEYSTDQQALADLEDEWQSNADPWEEFSDLSSGDFSRHSKGACQNLPDFLNSHEIKDYSKGDAIRVYDESHTDDEEDQRDKQQVIELQ